MCNKAIENYPHALEYVSECYKTQKVCDKADDTFHSTIKFVTECYKTNEICHRAVHRCFFVFDSILDKYISLINICPYKYVTQEICDEAVNDSLATLKLIPDWFVKSKTFYCLQIKILNAVCRLKYILFK